MPCYVCVGHVTRDLQGTGWTFGGTAFHAGLAAARLGCSVRAVTCMHPADARVLGRRHPGVEWMVRPTRVTTTFRNLYAHGARDQRMAGRATAIRPADVARACAKPCVVHLGPVAWEIGPPVASAIPSGTLVGLTAQGLVRRVDADGRVRWRPWRRRRALLEAVDVAILSDEDIEADPGVGRAYLRQARLGILTRGSLPLEVYEAGRVSEVPVRPTTDRKPTGAGDAFAAAFLTEFHANGELGRSIAFAAAAGALWVERSALLAFPARDEIEQSLRDSA